MNIFKKAATVASFLLSATLLHAQLPNWQNMDLQKDSVFGISTEKAYSELLQGKKSVPVVVAIVDSGIDTAHEDLKAHLWVNVKEKRFNKFLIGKQK